VDREFADWQNYAALQWIIPPENGIESTQLEAILRKTGKAISVFAVSD